MWSANCGASFGHELMFSTTLEKAKNGVGRNFETVKIAHGGSRMFEDWCPNNGRYWDALNSYMEPHRSRESLGRIFLASRRAG